MACVMQEIKLDAHSYSLLPLNPVKSASLPVPQITNNVAIGQIFRPVSGLGCFKRSGFFPFSSAVFSCSSLPSLPFLPCILSLRVTLLSALPCKTPLFLCAFLVPLSKCSANVSFSPCDKCRSWGTEEGQQLAQGHTAGQWQR